MPVGEDGRGTVNVSATLMSFELTRRRNQINQLFNMILHVKHNEETSCLKIVHFQAGTVPSEMEANAKSR